MKVGGTGVTNNMIYNVIMFPNEQQFNNVYYMTKADYIIWEDYTVVGSKIVFKAPACTVLSLIQHTKTNFDYIIQFIVW